MPRRAITPLLIGTFILRANGGAGTIIFGLFLAQLASHTGNSINSLQVGLLSVVYFATELVLAPIMGSLSDRWHRRYFLIIGPMVGLIEVALIPFAPFQNPLPYFLGLRLISGTSSAITTLAPSIPGISGRKGIPPVAKITASGFIVFTNPAVTSASDFTFTPSFLN